MKKLGILSLLAFTLLAACGQTEEDSRQGANPNLNLEPIEVEIIAPIKADKGVDIVIQTLVTQGEEKVNDASEVTFEIWAQGQKESSEMIDAELTDDDGIYEISYRFTEDNLYFIQPHVTARGMHRMPVGEIVIGEGPAEIIEESGDDHHHSSEHHHDHHHGEAINENLTLDWKTPEEANLNEEVELIVAVQWMDEPWLNGEVTYEIWQENDRVHQWLDAEEGDGGTYTLTHSFDQTGEFYIIIHLEDEEIHEHILKSIHIHGGH